MSTRFPWFWPKRGWPRRGWPLRLWPKTADPVVTPRLRVTVSDAATNTVILSEAAWTVTLSDSATRG